ncbi:MAG: sulfatase-like hydrolase/transferase, partial [Chitinivibrionia bacterium]|nr:sulfatase-like hydrolase/transferase [Chitinivibrionia bacterium]
FSGTLAVILCAALCGCALMDIAFLVGGAPGLLAPAHWYSLLHLVVSSIVVYAVIGFLAAGYALVVFGFVRLFRRRPRGDAAVLAAIVSFPLFLVMLRALQSAMLGTYISARSPFFVLPVLIAVLILLAATGIVVACAGFLAVFSGFRFRRFRFLIYFAAFAIAFAAVAGVRGHSINVLGVFPGDTDRALRRESKPNNPSQARSGAPNFIVVIIECLRSDHFTPDTAPFLWRLAEDNVYFSRHYVAAPATRPSITSFFVSLYPVQHNCYNLAGGRTSSGAVMQRRIPDHAKGFPRLLQEHGYRTL